MFCTSLGPALVPHESEMRRNLCPVTQSKKFDPLDEEIYARPFRNRPYAKPKGIHALDPCGTCSPTAHAPEHARRARVAVTLSRSRDSFVSKLCDNPDNLKRILDHQIFAWRIVASWPYGSENTCEKCDKSFRGGRACCNGATTVHCSLTPTR